MTTPAESQTNKLLIRLVETVAKADTEDPDFFNLAETTLQQLKMFASRQELDGWCLLLAQENHCDWIPIVRRK